MGDTLPICTLTFISVHCRTYFLLFRVISTGWKKVGLHCPLIKQPLTHLPAHPPTCSPYLPAHLTYLLTLPTCSPYLPAHLTYLLTHLPAHLTYLLTHLPAHLTYLLTHLPAHLTYLPTNLHIYPSSHLFLTL